MPNIQWSAAPLSARDMLNLLHVRDVQTIGHLTATVYKSMLELIASRSGMPIDMLLAKPADEISLLALQCYESLGTVMTSEDILKKAFGEQPQQ